MVEQGQGKEDDKKGEEVVASVLIKGLKMPKSCILCPFGNEFGECCVNSELEDANELTHSCPLVELPDHGELIDRDALNTIKGKTLLEAVYYAPVIIPAERSEDA